MTTKNILKYLERSCAVFLVCLCVVGGIAADAWASHEILKATSTSNVPVEITTRWTEDLVVEWQQPTMGSDTLKGYYFLWNTTETSLNSEDISKGSFNTTQMDVLPSAADYASKPKEELASLDSGSEIFLHVITHYQLSDGGEERVSQDVVFGPFWIDNVAPTATIRIVDANGNDITSTASPTVKVKLAASPDTAKAYLNESAETLTSLHIDPYAVDAEYSFANISEGGKTIYAWFEDSVGNISTPVTDSVTLLAATHIDPFTATIDLTSGGVRGFSVVGTSATYNWSIIQTGSVAEFSGASANVNTVTVQALAEGTFQLQATPTAGGDPLTSGTITVMESATPGDVDNDGEITLLDVRLAFRIFGGIVSPSAQQLSSANVYDDDDGGTTITLHDVRGVFRLFGGLDL